MGCYGGIKLSDNVVPIQALAPVVPSSASPVWVSLKNVRALKVTINVRNATTVTGSAIGLQQATAVAGTSAKTLAFTSVLANIDTAANGQPNWTVTAVSNNTFTTTAVNSKNAIYVIDVDISTLDAANGFDCFRVTVGDGTATTIGVTYHIEPLFGGNATATPLATTD